MFLTFYMTHILKTFSLKNIARLNGEMGWLFFWLLTQGLVKWLVVFFLFIDTRPAVEQNTGSKSKSEQCN